MAWVLESQRDGAEGIPTCTLVTRPKQLEMLVAKGACRREQAPVAEGERGRFVGVALSMPISI